jgi:hypothetical protein
VPILAWLTIRNSVAKPSMRFSNSGLTASGARQGESFRSISPCISAMRRRISANAASVVA